jgi:uncharacterized protein YegP (UPF0339 family)
MPRPDFAIRWADDGHPYFVTKGKNGEVITTSETYATMQKCREGCVAGGYEGDPGEIPVENPDE